MNNLKSIRESRGLTKKQAARTLHLRYDYYNALENGTFDDNEIIQAKMPELEKQVETHYVPKLAEYSHPIVLTPAIGKGGVGKTTSVINIAGVLAEMGYQVLIIDTTEQCDTTLTFLSTEELNNAKTIYSAIEGVDDLKPYVCHTQFPMIDIVPSDYRMNNIEALLATMVCQEQILKMCMQTIIEENMYDFILLDASNHLGSFKNVVWMCSNPIYLYSTVKAEAMDIRQLPPTINTISNCQKTFARYGQDIRYLGNFISKINFSQKVAEESLEVVKQILGAKNFDCYVRQDANISSAIEEQQPVINYKRSAKASRDYTVITNEILRRVEEMEYGEEKQ